MSLVWNETFMSQSGIGKIYLTRIYCTIAIVVARVIGNVPSERAVDYLTYQHRSHAVHPFETASFTLLFRQMSVYSNIRSLQYSLLHSSIAAVRDLSSAEEATFVY